MKNGVTLELVNLNKRYKSVHALKDFNYRFTEGVYGLLGPNGAGKSTLMNLITDNLEPDEGEIQFCGTPIGMLGEAYLKEIGYMPQQQNLYRNFTGVRFLYYMAALKGLSKKEADAQIPELLRMVTLTEKANKKIGAYSGGMKQRILIAQALLGNPKLVIMDEPTAGLDPKERIRIRNIISRISFQRIVIVATHVVPDIEFISKEVLLLKKGEIAAHGRPEELLRLVDGKLYEIETDREGLAILEKKYQVVNVSKNYDTITVRILCEEPPAEYRRTVPKANLEDVYLYRFQEEEK